MSTTAPMAVQPAPPPCALFFARSIEHLLDWAEPTIRTVCWSVWQEARRASLERVVEIEDLYQEGRIGVFQAAEVITSARRPRALAAAIVRRRVSDALRRLMPRRE
jgi:DNA-directed RNA polymerase specialized sigma24 family protein